METLKKFSLPLFWLAATFLSVFLFHATVDLKPQVEENFFFSSNDPQFQADKTITRVFSQSPQIIMSAKGDLNSEEYQKKIAELTADLLTLPEVLDVQSMSRGPKNPANAMASPLWGRALISTDKKASFLSILLKNEAGEKIIAEIEKIRTLRNVPERFELTISGAPYIVEIIRRHLFRDLKVFSLVAFVAFAVAVFMLFRSIPILLGTLISCLNVSLLTLSVSAMLKIKIGPLTSNLAVIVFVLALTHIVFITFNWKHVPDTFKREDSVAEAVRITIRPSFWSMITQLLGFMSLFLVKATPLRQLGISGIVGTLTAFGTVYLIYPAFLRWEALRPGSKKEMTGENLKTHFFDRLHPKIAAFLLILTAIAAFGIKNLNTDPSLMSYFKKHSELRKGLNYIDKNGGSTPLNIVVAAQDGTPLDTNDAYAKLTILHAALEKDPAVGNVVSFPVLMAEAKTGRLASLLPTTWLVNLLGRPKFGEVTKYFLTADKKNALFLLRMKEGGRTEARLAIVARIEETVKQKGFDPVLVGGVYLLQGKLSEMVVSSILTGLFLLILIFTLIGGFIARSLRVAAAILISLCMIPLWTIGLLGHLRVPFDIISSPGANIAIGIGVDSMLNMLFFVKRHAKNAEAGENVWFLACTRLWKPILYSTVLTCIGFGIFILSSFPPTQRFGLSVILGTLMSPLAALFVFPWIAAGHAPRKV